MKQIHPNDVCLYRSKTVFDLTDRQLYFRVNFFYKTDETFDFRRTDRHFRFDWFEDVSLLKVSSIENVCKIFRKTNISHRLTYVCVSEDKKWQFFGKFCIRT